MPQKVRQFSYFICIETLGLVKYSRISESLGCACCLGIKLYQFLQNQEILSKHCLMVVPHCLMWCLWRDRNNQCFEDTERITFISNYFSLELCWIGCQFCIVIPYGLLLSCQIYVIYVIGCKVPFCILPVWLGLLFDSNKNNIIAYQKNNKNSLIAMLQLVNGKVSELNSNTFGMYCFVLKQYQA